MTKTPNLSRPSLMFTTTSYIKVFKLMFKWIIILFVRKALLSFHGYICVLRGCPQKQEEGTGSLAPERLIVVKSPDVGTRNPAPLLYKIIRHSFLLSQLSSPCLSSA